MTKTVSEPQEFLKQFFGDGNAIQWDQYELGEPTASVRLTLEPWVTRFEKQRSPFCLPRVNPETKQTAWYVLCSDHREARSMRESLQAFIGPTYADFNGELAAFTDGDSIDQLCQTHFGSLVFRVPVANGSDRKKVNSLLSTLINFRDRESSRSLATIKPIGRLLRDLEMAIIGCNEESAWKIYSEIRSRGRLSAVNLAFLQVHIFGSFDHWTEILSMPNLSDLLQVRRPKRISEQIAKAVYCQFFLKHEQANNAQSAIDSFRSVGARYHNLMRSTEGLQNPDAIKFAVLNSVAADPPNRTLAERLMESSVSDTDRPWCDSLLSRLETPAVSQVVSPRDVADVRYNENNFDEALALYLSQTPNYRSVCRVLETAVEVDSNVAAKKAIEYLNSAPDDIRGKVLGRRVCTSHIGILDSILGKNAIHEARPIASLEDWFQCVDQEQDLGNANRVLEYGIQNWADESRFDPSRIADLLKLSRIGKAAEVIRNAVPTFIRSFLVDRPASRENKPIYASLMELLIYDDTIGADDLTAVEQLAEAVLTAAPNHEAGNNDFTFATDITVHLWETIAAPRYLDWVLSMLDLLIDTGAQQHADLTPTLAAIADSSRAWTRRVSDAQWSLLELLADDLNLPELVSGLRPKIEENTEVAEVDIRELLKGKSIAIYSLTERIARRFGQLAEQTFDDIKIHYVHDKTLTDRMKNLAQSADIFIVNTWDAKHAATNGIKDNRSNAAITLEPNGKSATSLLRSLQEFAINCSWPDAK